MIQLLSQGILLDGGVGSGFSIVTNAGLEAFSAKRGRKESGLSG